MRLLYAVTAVLAGLASAQRPGQGGGGQQGGQQGGRQGGGQQGGQQGGRGPQQIMGRGGGSPMTPGNIDMCQAVRDPEVCKQVNTCVYGPIPEGARRGTGGPGGSGRPGTGGGRPGGRRRLQRGGGGPRGSGRGNPGGSGNARVGCYSECFDVKEEAACSGSCRWSTGPGSGSGRGPGRGSGPRGRGPGGRRRLQRQGGGGQQGGGGRGPPGQSGRSTPQPRCVPMREKVDTGLEVVIKIYTDQQCTELFQPGTDQNQGPVRGCKDKTQDECDDMENCTWGEGNDRYAEPHCRPNFGGSRGSGSGRGSGGRGSGRGRPGGRRLQQQGGQGSKRTQLQNWMQNQRQGRGQDFEDRGRGGNPDQNRRLTSNTITRMIPVIDGMGEPKCSFDARGPGNMSSKFRMTWCAIPNQLKTNVYDDVLCTKLSEQADRMPVITRGECMPLPTPGGRGPGGSGSGRGRMSGSGRGRPGGRRRLQRDSDEQDFIDQFYNPDECDGEFDDNMDYNTLVDWVNELTCMIVEGDDDSAEERRSRNPCNGLRGDECEENDQCDYQRGVCVWNNAPENERNLYAIYEWQYLTKDGEETDEEFCYRGDTIADKDDYEAMCKSLTSEDSCKGMGCKSFKNDKCNPQNKKISCKKLGSNLDKKDKVEYKEELSKLCALYADFGGEGKGCKWSEKKGKCTGKVKLK